MSRVKVGEVRLRSRCDHKNVFTYDVFDDDGSAVSRTPVTLSVYACNKYVGQEGERQVDVLVNGVPLEGESVTLMSGDLVELNIKPKEGVTGIGEPTFIHDRNAVSDFSSDEYTTDIKSYTARFTINGDVKVCTSTFNNIIYENCDSSDEYHFKLLFEEGVPSEGQDFNFHGVPNEIIRIPDFAYVRYNVVPDEGYEIINTRTITNNNEGLDGGFVYRREARFCVDVRPIGSDDSGSGKKKFSVLVQGCEERHNDTFDTIIESDTGALNPANINNKVNINEADIVTLTITPKPGYVIDRIDSIQQRNQRVLNTTEELQHKEAFSIHDDVVLCVRTVPDAEWR